MDERLYRINPALRIQRFDEAGRTPRWLYELDDAKGRVQRLLVSPAMHRLLGAFESPRCLDWTPEELVADGWAASDSAILSRTLGEGCLPSRLLIPANDGAIPARHAPDQARRPGYMGFMFPLLNVAVVSRLAPVLQRFFLPAVMVAGVIVAVSGLVALMLALSRQVQFAAPDSADVLMAIGLGMFGVLLHELGHAAAAWRFGARSISIGVGWYVCFPVAYADLSETWRMSRRQRALIDVAGIYLQGLWVAMLMAWHLASGEAVALVAALSSAVSIVWNMNPLLRMDGYWLASDLLGIADLRQAAKASLSNWARRMCGMPQGGSPNRFNPRMAATLLAYGILSALFFAWMIFAACNHFGEAALNLIPQLAQRLWSSDWSRMDAADRWVLVGGFFWQLIMFVAIGRFLYLTGQRGWRRLRVPG